MDQKHIAVHMTIEGEEFQKHFELVRELVTEQVKSDLPILSFGIPRDLPSDKLLEFLKFFLNKGFFEKNKVKVSFIGKWYDLPSDVVEETKALIDKTKDYGDYFLNFVINYDGQQEIADACKIICKRYAADKIDLDAIDKSMIKENLYTSYFLAPDIIVKTGKEKKLDGFFLWDSFYSKIHFTGKPFLEFSVKEFKDILTG